MPTSAPRPGGSAGRSSERAAALHAPPPETSELVAPAEGQVLAAELGRHLGSVVGAEARIGGAEVAVVDEERIARIDLVADAAAALIGEDHVAVIRQL